MWKQEKFIIQDQSHVGEIRRHAISIAEELSYDETLTGKIAIVVTELATNIYKHARTGEIILSYSRTSCDVLSIDRGPGMDVQECMKDGFSTGGTAGGGLGAIKRGAHFFDIFSLPDKGTIIYVNFRKVDTEYPEICLGGICLPYPGEIVSGDSWTFCRRENGLKVMVADGLGHGLLAHEASRLAVEVFNEDTSRAPEEIMSNLHRALRSTRGAAIAIADLDVPRRVLNYCGVGNIATSIVSPGSVKRCISYNGTIGAQVKKMQTMPYPVDKDAVIIMASDGLSTHWDLKPYPGLLMKHPFIIAGVLYRDHGKGNDDISVVVFRGDP